VVDNDSVKSSESQSIVSIADSINKKFSPVDSTTMYSAVSKFILIEVEDSGIGIPSDKRHCLFRPFGQAQQRAGGTGLGLYSLSKRMEAIGGQCGMCNPRDGSHGSRFWFSIPYVPDTDTDASTSRKSSKIKTSPSIESDAGTVMHSRHPKEYYGVVLLVDDSLIIIKTTKRMLEKEGYEVKVAQNGAESLALMKANHYQFVLTDIQMPLMDGLEATRRIREHEMACQVDGVSFPRQCIIGMSADSSVETKNQAMSCGMDSFMPKPVHVSKLRKLLADMAEEKC
jgi:two-component system, sensor histidine kinase